MSIHCLVFKKSYQVNHAFVQLYGSRSLADWQAAGKIHVIDEVFFKANPKLKG
jgi:hypothetical protein